MDEICRVTITATGPAGSGKTMATDFIRKSLEHNRLLQFCVIDGEMTETVRLSVQATLIMEARQRGKLPILVEIIEQPA